MSVQNAQMLAAMNNVLLLHLAYTSVSLPSSLFSFYHHDKGSIEKTDTTLPQFPASSKIMATDKTLDISPLLLFCFSFFLKFYKSKENNCRMPGLACTSFNYSPFTGMFSPYPKF